MDRAVFFDAVRKTDLFPRGRLTTAQVNGMEDIMDGWEKWGYGLDTGLSYVLATPWWETGKRMVPVRETFATSTKQAISRLDAAFKANKMKWVKTPYWRAGWFGRGLVQITHEDNYAGALRDAVKREFGVDIHADPDLALRPDIAVFLLIEGTTRGVTLKSDYTAYALEDFINDGKTDYENARKTVNPKELSSFGTIAEAARKFEGAIRAAREAAGEEFKGPAGRNLYDGKRYDEVESVQEQLVAKGYPVGDVDGRWGRMTRRSVLDFRIANDLPAKENITDKDFLAALVTADKATVSGERAQTTVADLRQKGSESVKTADKIDWTGRAMLTAGGLGALDKGLDTAEKYSSYAERVKALIDPITSIITDNVTFVLFGLGAVIVWQAIKHKNITKEEYRAGEKLTA